MWSNSTRASILSRSCMAYAATTRGLGELPMSVQPSSPENRTRRNPRPSASGAAPGSTGTTVPGHAVVGLVADGSSPMYLSALRAAVGTCMNLSAPCNPLIRKLLPEEKPPSSATLISDDAARVRMAETSSRSPANRRTAPSSSSSASSSTSHFWVRSNDRRSSSRSSEVSLMAPSSTARNAREALQILPVAVSGLPTGNTPSLPKPRPQASFPPCGRRTEPTSPQPGARPSGA